MQFLEGRIFTDPALPSISPSDRRAWWVGCTPFLASVVDQRSWFSDIDTLAKLHRISPKDVGLSNYGKATGFYARQLKTFDRLSPLQGDTIDADTGNTVGAIPHWPDLTAWFKANMPADRTSIVHGDFKLDNCVFHTSEPRVVGILDWELSTIGHPLSDLANLLQPYGLPSGNESSLAGFAGHEAPVGVPSLSEAQARYAVLAKWDPAVNWTFAEAFAHLRVSSTNDSRSKLMPFSWLSSLRVSLLAWPENKPRV